MNDAPLVRWLSEAAGTALLVGIGTGTIVASARVGGISLGLMAVAWSAAVLLPILLFIRVSGAHLNPAVTLALAGSGRIAWREVPPYVASQLGGAFLGSGLVWAVLGRGDHLGATLPAHGDLIPVIVGEMTFSALLVGAVFLLSDQGEGRRRWRLLLPTVAVGLSTYVIGPFTGSSLNPARSIAPAVLSGTYTDLWAYLLVVPTTALALALVWRPRSVDRLDRGPGRLDSSR
ncbi:MAG: aquaporin [Thermoplasmata archaeon]|nr:aquaporin [Thermoplasmata archaeon]